MYLVKCTDRAAWYLHTSSRCLYYSAFSTLDPKCHAYAVLEMHLASGPSREMCSHLLSPLRVPFSGHPSTDMRAPASSSVASAILIKCVITNIIFWSRGQAVISMCWWCLNGCYEKSRVLSNLFTHRVENKPPPGFRCCETKCHKHSL